MNHWKEDTECTLYSKFKDKDEYLEMLEAAVDESNLGFLITDADGVVIKVNESQTRITNQVPSYNIKKNMRDVQIEDGSPSASIKVLDSREPVQLEQVLSTGRSYFVDAKPYFDTTGALKYVISNLLDTTAINRTIDEIRETNAVLNLQLSELRNQMDPQNRVIHQSQIMRQLMLLCDKVAQFDSSVLILGESGVGKERVAEYIFKKSPREKKPFIKLNCAAIPENLIESELFGYAPGAFTGANAKGKKGLLEYGDGGTILFDEISELSLPLQAKLLRFLQEGEFYHLGGVTPVQSDVRVIAASNKDLETMVAQGEFREDLFYRLNVIPVHIPPLRERAEDIPLLIGYFTQKFNEKHSLQKRFNPEAVAVLCKMPYKGNVRELQNAIERILVLAESDSVTREQVENIMGLESIELLPDEAAENLSMKEMIEIYEERIIKKFMEIHGTEEKVSKVLKVSQSTVSRKVSRMRERKNPYIQI